MKKRYAIYIFLIAIILMLVVLCEYYKNSNNTTIEVSTKESITSGKIIKPTTYLELNNLLIRDKTSMVVFGRMGCEYCAKYLPVLEDIVKTNNIDIIYVDILSLDKEDYNKVLSEFTIPGKCTDDNVDKPLSNGFGTPLTLFIKNGESLDCIRGYTTKEVVFEHIKKELENN